MRLPFCVLSIGCVLAACGGYHISGHTVTFERCGDNGCNTSTVKEADPKSFETLQGSYAKDRHHVFFSGTAIQEADPQSFKVLSDTYAKDNAHAYFESNSILGADAASFVALNDLNYGRDKNDIYILGSAIAACDAASFRWLKDDWQVDSKCAYMRGKKLPNAHPESFVVLNDWYAKDAEQVYSSVSDKAIDGADIATFTIETLCGSCAHDKNRCYDSGLTSACGLH